VALMSPSRQAVLAQESLVALLAMLKFEDAFRGSSYLFNIFKSKLIIIHDFFVTSCLNTV
jgi:hypothetical protein